MFEHQQLLSGTRTSGYCSIRNSGLVSNQDLGIKNSSGYMCLYTISIQYILQRPLTKYLQCPLSIPTHVFSVHCPYKLLSISTISNTKVDQYQSRSSDAVKQSDSRQQQMFQKLNKKSIVTRLHMFFFSSRRRHTRSCLVSWARRCV